MTKYITELLTFIYYGATAASLPLPQEAKASSLSRIQDHIQTQHNRYHSSG